MSIVKRRTPLNLAGSVRAVASHRLWFSAFHAEPHTFKSVSCDICVLLDFTALHLAFINAQMHE